jgi:NADH dehydrogenase
LIVAAGSRHHYFGHPEWEAHAPGLKTIEDATNIRRRIFSAFEAAEREEDSHKQATWLTFVVVGGGPTGVELAGALAEIARHTLSREFRRVDTATARILLVEAGPRVLANFSESHSAKAAAALTSLGVTVRTGTTVAQVEETSVLLRSGEVEERVATNTVLWGAGVQGEPFGKILAAATNAEIDKAGRVAVGPDCAISNHPAIFVIGDLAHVGGSATPPLPGVAPVAMQQGTYVAKLIQARLDNRTMPPFQYQDPGTMATIGRRLAIAQVGQWRLSGTIAWLAWLFVHLMALVRFENRLLVLLQWSWHYFTWNRNARLITKEPASLEGASESSPNKTSA